MDILSVALDNLTIGRTALYRAILEDSSYDTCYKPMEAAVSGLRAAGSMHELPRGLLTRAMLRFMTRDIDGAEADLDEAQEIAERGSMKLFLADIHLYRARLFQQPEHLGPARKLIEECNYGRRLPELEAAEAALGVDPAE